MAQPWDHDLAVVHGQLTDTMKDAVLLHLGQEGPGLRSGKPQKAQGLVGRIDKGANDVVRFAACWIDLAHHGSCLALTRRKDEWRVARIVHDVWSLWCVWWILTSWNSGRTHRTNKPSTRLPARPERPDSRERTESGPVTVACRLGGLGLGRVSLVDRERRRNDWGMGNEGGRM